jgi:hypothetical protein
MGYMSYTGYKGGPATKWNFDRREQRELRSAEF